MIMGKDNFEDDISFERNIIRIMMYEDITMSDALLIDMFSKGINLDSVFDMCDYLEDRLDNLDKVEYFMDVITGRAPDQYLKKI